MTMVLADAQYGQRGGGVPMPGTENSDRLDALHAFCPVVHDFSMTRGSVNLFEPLGQLNVGAPRILDERGRDVERGHLRVRAIQRDAHPFQLSAERLEALHLKADVVERAATCA